MQRIATKTTRGASAQEKKWHKWMRNQPCFVCDRQLFGHGVMHHCMGSTYKHNKVLIGHWFCNFLCTVCDDIITRGSRRQFKNIHGPQSVFTLKYMQIYEDDTGVFVPEDVKEAIADCNE